MKTDRQRNSNEKSIKNKENKGEKLQKNKRKIKEIIDVREGNLER